MEEIYNKILNHIKEQIPNFELVKKQDSSLMKCLNFFIGLFNKTFMTNFTTTIYPKIYVTDSFDKDDANSRIELLCHEYVHLKDRKNWKILFNLMYLKPQLSILLSLLAFWNLWFLLCLFFILPLPSFGRAYIEFRGYTMSMAVNYWLIGTKYDIDWIVKQFTSSNYYYMFPFKTYLTKKFEKEFEKIKNNNFSFKQLEEIHKIVKEEI